MTLDDFAGLDVPDKVQQAIYDFLEHGKPNVNVCPYKGTYQERVMLVLNDLLNGQGIENIVVDGEVMAQYIKGPEPTIVYDERTGGYWVMRAENWSPF